MITAMPFHSIWVAESNAHKGGYILQLITWLLHIMFISTFYVTVAWLHSKWMQYWTLLAGFAYSVLVVLNFDYATSLQALTNN